MPLSSSLCGNHSRYNEDAQTATQKANRSGLPKVMTEEDRKQRNALIQSCVDKLAEHFDSVRIFVTCPSSDGEPNTAAPKVMKQAPEPVGMLNNNWLVRIASEARIIVACWGNDGGHMGRSSRICKMLGTKLHILKINEKTGQPAHPLYLSKTLRPVPWPKL